MNPVIRIIRSVIQLLVSGAFSVPIVTLLHLSPGATAAVISGLYLATVVIHNAIDALGILEKYAPKVLHVPDIIKAMELLAQLNAAAQTVFAQPQPQAEKPAAEQPLHPDGKTPYA